MSEVSSEPSEVLGDMDLSGGGRPLTDAEVFGNDGSVTFNDLVPHEAVGLMDGVLEKALIGLGVGAISLVVLVLVKVMRAAPARLRRSRHLSPRRIAAFIGVIVLLVTMFFLVHQELRYARNQHLEAGRVTLVERDRLTGEYRVCRSVSLNGFTCGAWHAP